MVASVAVRAQSWAEISSPAAAEAQLTARAQQNMPPAERAKLRGGVAGVPKTRRDTEKRDIPALNDGQSNRFLSFDGRLEFGSDFSKVFRPVQGQRIHKGNLAADLFGHLLGTLGRKLRLHEDYLDLVLPGMFDQFL